MKGNSSIILKFVAAVILACSAATAAAQPVRFIVPFAAGGASDILARTLGQKMAESMGTQVIVDNRPGASGLIGLMAIRASGSTPTLALLQTSSLIATLGHRPDLVQDFQMVSLLGTSGMVIVSTRDATIADLVERAKRAQQFSFGSFGIGSVSELCFAQFLKGAGRQSKGAAIPYKGAAPMLTDLMGGNLEAACVDISAAIPHIRAGKLRALAVTLPYPHDQLPGVPTLESAGVQGVLAGGWFAAVASKGTSRATLNSLAAGLKQALSDTQVQSRLGQMYLNPVPANDIGPEIADQFIQNQIAQLRPYAQLTAQAAGGGSPPASSPTAPPGQIAQAPGASPPSAIVAVAPSPAGNSAPGTGGSSAPGSPDFQPSRPSPSGSSGSAAGTPPVVEGPAARNQSANNACIAAIDRQEAEFRPISQRIANTQSVVHQTQLLMDMLKKRMALLDQLCKGQPLYSTYAGTKQQFDSAMRSCLGIATNSADCGGPQPVRADQNEPLDCSRPFSGYADANGKCVGSPICCRLKGIRVN